MKTLLLYIPVLHQGYVKLFSEQANSVDRLLVLGSDVIADFPELSREVRAVAPEMIVIAIRSLKMFKKVQLLNKKDLARLATDAVVVADDDISERLRGQYFPDAKIKRVTPFLRWDSKNVLTVNEVSPDRIVTTDQTDRELIGLAERAAEKSSDWYRQVGAVLVKDGAVLFSSYNQRQPSPQTPYIDGDPRNFLPLGSKTELRTTLHAEQAVIVAAAKNGVALEGASIYVTTFPCPDCAQLIAHSGIKKCYYSSGYSSLDGERVLKYYGVELIFVETK